jgi:hypothetical protein
MEHEPLSLGGEAEVSSNLCRDCCEQPGVSLAGPCGGRCRSGDHELLNVVDGDQLDRLEPDRERVLADRELKLAADVSPVVAVGDGRAEEAAADLVEVDAD